MISVFLQGGLGNQLFQIFTTIAYGLKHNKIFIFTHDDTLKYGIERNTYWSTFLQNLEKYTTKYSDENITNQDILTTFLNFQENDFHYTQLPDFNHNTNIMLRGYFQSYLYFHEFKKCLFEMIGLKSHQKKIMNKFDKYLQKKEDRPFIKTISMHFRIGDYITKTDYHCITPYEYYSNVMKELHNKGVLIGKVLCFCEKVDNAMVNTMIYKLKNENPLFEFIKIDDDIDDWEQMLIMSCCDVNIMANSTFSWWGAYFNQTDEPMVFYPYRWFGPQLNKYNLKDLHPPEWYRMEF